MSELPLPDDLAHWPEDPNELLGVSFGVTPRELRRVYNRLIRIYKPEQFPEQFRRIREAYEYLLRIAEMFARRAEAPDSPTTEEPQILPAPKDSLSDDGAVEWVAGSPRPAEEEVVPARMRWPKEEENELWESATLGNPAAAYERFAQLTQQHAGRTQLYLRLYWLRTLFPQVDARRVPADWLVQGLLATDLAGPLRELYREEVTDNPAEALSERYEQLLDAPISASQLTDLIEWRFQAAARLQKWDVLHTDLARLRPRFSLGEEQLWLRLLFSLADSAAWAADAEGAKLLAACREEIGQYEHIASTMSHWFDRFDLLVEAASGWFSLCDRSHVPAIMLRLIRNSWSHPLAEVRESLMNVLEAMADSPYQWLAHLDEIRQRAPATLAVFGELLDRFEEVREVMPEESREREQINGLVLSFLPQLNVANYEVEQTRLLRFCVQENLAPEEMAEVARGFTGGWEELGAAWARALTADWPLRYVYRACRLFWA
ncbi:MAG TPA: J domain-containing protein [Gemmataceae bacterium]|jgi:hypothetical protein